jgi:hypothetical protein
MCVACVHRCVHGISPCQTTRSCRRASLGWPADFRVPTRMVLQPAAAPSCADCHVAVVRRATRQGPLLAAVGVHHVDLRVSVALAYKCDLLAVWRPGRNEVVPRRARQSPLPAPIRVHDVDVGAANAALASSARPASACEGDLPPVRRPGRIAFVPRAARQVPLPPPVGVHGENFEVTVALARESDLPPVWRPGRGGRPRDASRQPPLPLPSTFMT